MIAVVGFVRELRSVVEQRVDVGLELAIVVDWNAAAGIGGVLRILSGFRTSIIFLKTKIFFDSC